MDLPDHIQEYLETHLIERARVFCVAVDGDNIAVEAWGDAAAHGIDAPAPGTDASQTLPLLKDFGHAESILLPFVSLARNRHSHVHLFPKDQLRYALLLDARDEAAAQQRHQQATNELRLAYYRQSQLVDQLVEARAELDNRRKAAEETSRRQSEFIATLSHEVRTPLTSIIGYTDLLAEDKLESGVHIQAVRRGAQQLLELVNQLLARARSEAVGGDSKLTVFAPGTLLEELGEVIAPLAAEKGLSFSAQATTELPRFVRADRVRLRQVLMNLLSNAVKYTVDGGIKLSVAFDEMNLLFRVQDTGAGIALADQQRIFHAFERLAATDANIGAGLGLSIAMQLVRRLDGNLRLDSTPGQGSCFEFSVPTFELMVADGPASARILIVEDDPDIRALLALQLARIGYQIDAVADGARAVRAVADAPPDVVVMDLRMPDMSGIEAAQTMRDGGFDGPIVALSASRDRAEIERALGAGYSDYLFKPLDKAELAAAIERALVDAR